MCLQILHASSISLLIKLKCVYFVHANETKNYSIAIDDTDKNSDRVHSTAFVLNVLFLFLFFHLANEINNRNKKVNIKSVHRISLLTNNGAQHIRRRRCRTKQDTRAQIQRMSFCIFIIGLFCASHCESHSATTTTTTTATVTTEKKLVPCSFIHLQNNRFSSYFFSFSFLMIHKSENKLFFFIAIWFDKC